MANTDKENDKVEIDITDAIEIDQESLEESRQRYLKEIEYYARREQEIRSKLKDPDNSLI